jgi:hypothetical protein
LKTKNLKVLAMILLTTTLLILASGASISTVKAATTQNVVLYTTLGASSVTANGTAMTLGGSNTFTSGNTETFVVTPSSGYKFLCWVYADASGPVASTAASYSKVISATCSLEAVCVPTTNTTATTSGSGAATLTVFATSGGQTDPAGAITGASVKGTIGSSTQFTETPGTGYTFLCWIVQCASNNEYTSSTLNYVPTSAGAAVEAIWVPTSSSVTLPPITTPTPTPKVDEISTAMAAIVVAALAVAALGTFAYKKSRK